LALHQQAADQLGGDQLGRAEKDWGRCSGSCWEGVVAMGMAEVNLKLLHN